MIEEQFTNGIDDKTITAEINWGTDSDKGHQWNYRQTTVSVDKKNRGQKITKGNFGKFKENKDFVAIRR